jgi:lysophospholipase L1-like esterase
VLRRAVLLGALLFLSGEQRIALHLAGDSTMAIKRDDRRPETGWGEALAPLFDSTAVRVVNHAMNGRSTRTFISEGRWQALVDSLRPGDWVFIQFGHNDESPEKADRYTPPAEFRANLVRMTGDVRAKGAHPVLLTPIARRKFDATGTIVDTHGDYPGIVRSVAAEQHVPLLDLHRATLDALGRLGPDSTRPLFLQLGKGEHPNYPDGISDNTHLSPRGAALVAALAVAAMRSQGLELAKWITLRR